MKTYIQKYGGSSVQTEENRRHAIRHIQEVVEQGDKAVVVVSAIGRQPDPYATDTLLSLVDFPYHYNSNRELDLLMSCGETIASVLLTNEMRRHNIAAYAMTGAQAGFLTNDHFTEAKIVRVDTTPIIDALKKHDVIVVAGFQGKTKDGEITTIGRGGSDTTAAELGVALEAEIIDIFTDVEGIMTADPGIVSTARPLPSVSYMDICNLAYQGAKVIHPEAVTTAMRSNIPMRVRSHYSNDKGTLISSFGKQNDANTQQTVTGIAHLKGISQIQVTMKDDDYKQQSDVFKVIAEAGISVDFINISPSRVIFTIPDFFAEKATDILTALGYETTITQNCAKVSAVGSGMTGIPGVAAQMVGALTQENIQILQSADSYTTIWVLVHGAHVEKAVNALHRVFDL